MAAPSPLEILAAGVSKSAQRLAAVSTNTPAGLALITQAWADQNDPALHLAIRDFINSLFYVVDLTRFALNDVLPPELGGGDYSNVYNIHGSETLDFRKFRASVKSALHHRGTPRPCRWPPSGT